MTVLVKRKNKKSRKSHAHLYACPQCKDVSFSTKIGIGIHMSKIHGVKNYTKDLQDNTSTKVVTIATSDIQPNSKGMYSCPECKRDNFTRKTSLGKHRVMHGIRSPHFKEKPQKTTKRNYTYKHNGLCGEPEIVSLIHCIHCSEKLANAIIYSNGKKKAELALIKPRFCNHCGLAQPTHHIPNRKEVTSNA